MMEDKTFLLFLSFYLIIGAIVYCICKINR